MKTLSKQETFLLLLRDFGGVKGLAFSIFTTEDRIKNWMYHHTKVPLEFAILMVVASHGKVTIISFYEPDEVTPAIQKVSAIVTPSLEEMFSSTECIELIEVGEPKAYLPREFVEVFPTLCDFKRAIVCDERNHLITGLYQYEMQKAMGAKMIKIFRVNIKKIVADLKPIPNILQFSVFERVLIGMRMEEVYKAISKTPSGRAYHQSVQKAIASGRLAGFKNQTEYTRLKTIYNHGSVEIMLHVARNARSIYTGVKGINQMKLGKENTEILTE